MTDPLEATGTPYRADMRTPAYKPQVRGRDADRAARSQRGRGSGLGCLCSAHGCVRPATVGMVLVITINAQKSIPTDIVTRVCREHVATALPDDITAFHGWSRIEKQMRRAFGRDLVIDPKTVGRRAVPI